MEAPLPPGTPRSRSGTNPLTLRARRPSSSGRPTSGGSGDGDRAESPDTPKVAKVPLLRTDVAQEVLDRPEEGLSEDFLRHFCETEDLESVTRLEIRLDSVEQSVEVLGSLLPSLIQLKLTDSSIGVIRDLGTGLVHLQILWMARCGLQDISGIGAMQSLRELYLPFNDVAELSPLSAHESLEVLDVEGNNLPSLDEVAALRMCGLLRELTLAGNPLCKTASFSRHAVLEILPQLEVLDDENADPLTARRTGDLPETDDLDDLDSDLDLYIAGFDVEVQPSADPEWSDDSGDDVGSEDDASPPPVAPAVVRSGVEAAATSLPPARPTSAAGVKPLNATHPLLAQGLQELASKADPDSYSGEPDEDDLVMERVKRARQRPHRLLPMTARPALINSWFNFQAPDRRRVRTAEPSVSEGFRPATTANSGIRFEDLRGDHNSASDLTCGSSLAGNPLSAVRQRRSHTSSSSSQKDGDMDIRALLQKFQNFAQGRDGAPPAGSRPSSSGTRLGTPDVRIHAAPTAQDLLRPASSGGGSRPGSGGSSRHGSRPGSGIGRPASGLSQGAQAPRPRPAGMPRPPSNQGSGGGRSAGAPAVSPSGAVSNGVPAPTVQTKHAEVLLVEEAVDID